MKGFCSIFLNSVKVDDGFVFTFKGLAVAEICVKAIFPSGRKQWRVRRTEKRDTYEVGFKKNGFQVIYLMTSRYPAIADIFNLPCNILQAG